MLLFALLTGSAGVFFWQLDSAEREADQVEFAAMANDAAVIFEDSVQRRIAVLSALAEMIEGGVLRDDVDFIRAASAISERHAGFIGINRMDAERVIRTVSPSGRNEAARGRKVGTAPEIIELLDRAEATLTPAATRLVPLFQGGQGVVTYHPVVVDGAFDGFVNGVIDLPALLDAAARKISSQIVLTVTEHDRPVGVEAKSQNEFHNRRAIEVLNRTWILAIDTRRLPGQPEWSVSAWGAVFTVPVSALAATLLFFALRSRQRALASESRYRAYVDIASDWQWETDADLRLTFASPQAARKRGVPSEALMYRRTDEFDTVELVAGDWAAHVRRMRAHEPFRDFVYGLRAADGQVNWLRVNGRPTFDDGGAFLGYQGTALNVTAAVEAKIQLDAAHQRLIDAIESIPAGVAIYDAEDRKALANDRNRELVDLGRVDAYPIGIKYEDVQRDLVARGLIPAAKSDPEGWIRTRMAAHRAAAEPVQVRLASGSVVEIHERRLSDGGTIILRFDVTERVQMLERIAASEDRYRLLFQQNPAPVWMFDRATGAVLDANAAALRDYGYERGDLPSLTMAQLCGGEPEWSAIAASLAAAGSLQNQRQRHRRKDGRVLEVECAVDAIDLQGRTVGLLLAHDVSARMAAERRLADFMSASADWLWETDSELRFTWWSDTFAEQIGIEAAELRSIGQLDVLATLPDSAAVRAHKAVLQAHAPFKDFEFPIDLSGRRRWFRVSAVPIFDAAGGFQGYRGVGRDITEIKAAQARLLDAIESIPAGVSIFDADDRVVMENSANRLIAGKQLDFGASGKRRQFEELLREAVGRGIIVVDPDPETWIARRMDAHRNPREPFLIHQRDGSVIEAHEHRMSDGGAILLRFDVTERVQAAAAIAASEARYRALFQHNPDPMALIDRETFEILEVNEAAIDAYGYSREELRGMRGLDLRAPEEIDEARRQYGVGDGISQRNVPARHRRKDGSVFEVEVSRDFLSLDGRDVVLVYARDVSARAAAERRLGDFMTASADWLWETDGEYRFTWASSNVEQVFGVPAGTMYGVRQFDVAAGSEVTEGLRAHWEDLRAQRPFRDFDFQAVTAKGLRWLRVSGVPYFDAKGTFAGYRGTGRDVTDLKMAEARLADAVEAIPAGVVILDEAERITLRNRQAATLSPRMAELLVPGATLADVLQKAVARNLIAAPGPGGDGWIRRRLAGERYAAGPTTLRAVSGRAYDLFERPIAGGGSIILWFDVTERLDAADRVAASEAHLQAAMDATVDGIITIDAVGGILSVNKAAEKLFGYGAGELVGQNVQVLMPEPHRSDYGRYLRAYQETGEAKVIGIGRELRGLRRDGSEFDLDLAVAEMPAGFSGRFIGTLRDITLRKQTEEQLRQAQKMEAVGQLTGGVAHDFNNVLAIISLNLELAAGRVAADPLLKEMLDMSLKATSRGAELTRRLLAFARRQPLAPRTLDLGEEARELGKLLERTLPEPIALAMAISGEAVHAVLDSTQLQNALLNLALNARDAMRGGGKLTISLARETIAAGAIDWPDPVPAGTYGVIAIADTGCGIAPDLLHRVLEPFFTTKPVGQGTGLGLSMVYGFVRQSGGWLDLASQPGRGTTIRLLFPLAGGTAAAPAPAVAAKRSREVRHRILLVEDYDELRRSLSQILGELGFDVVSVADGEAALAAIDGPEPIDGLLTDIGLPGSVDGDEVCRRARARRPDLKIITMSGHADRAATATDGSAQRHLQKPFARTVLAGVLDELFSG